METHDFHKFYEADGVTIYNARAEHVLPSLGRFDLLLTDPPWGIGYGGSKPVGGTEGRKKHFWRTWETEWDDEIVPQWVIDMAIASANTSIVWGGNYYALPPTRGWLVWDKVQREFSLADAELAWTNRDAATRVLSMTRSRDARVHPTQKPLKLMQWCLNLVGGVESLVDPFMGSGTSLVAAKLAGIRAVGIEVSEEYCRMAVERLRQGVLAFND